MSELLNVLDKITPGSDLRAYIHELRQHGHQKVGITEQFGKAAVVTGGFMFALNVGKFCSPNQQCPEDRDGAQNEIRRNHSQRF